VNRHERDKQKKSPAAAAASAAQSLAADIARALREPVSEDGLVAAATFGEALMDGAVAIGWEGSEHAPACADGCNYCCQGERVAVTLPEVARAVAHAQRHLDPAALGRVEQRARDNAPQTHGRTARGYPLRLPCALLGEDGRCSVYDARPMLCRREHSLDVSQCKAGFDNDDVDRDMSVEHAHRVMALADATVEAYRSALSDAGTDAGYYELQEALHLMLSSPQSTRAWLDGADAFASARLDESVEDAARPGLLQLQTKRE